MMASEPGSRPLLPQTTPLNYSFVPQPQRPAEPAQRSMSPRPARCLGDTILTAGVADYVFVDEHNRHKRLKGMPSQRLYYDVTLERLTVASDARMRWLPEEEDQVRRRHDEYLAMWRYAPAYSLDLRLSRKHLN